VQHQELLPQRLDLTAWLLRLSLLLLLLLSLLLLLLPWVRCCCHQPWALPQTVRLAAAAPADWVLHLLLTLPC
jgi:hypothetical protein